MNSWLGALIILSIAYLIYLYVFGSEREEYRLRMELNLDFDTIYAVVYKERKKNKKYEDETVFMLFTSANEAMKCLQYEYYGFLNSLLCQKESVKIGYISPMDHIIEWRQDGALYRRRYRVKPMSLYHVYQEPEYADRLPPSE